MAKNSKQSKMVTSKEEQRVQRTLFVAIILTSCRMVTLTLIFIYIVIPCLLFCFPALHNAAIFMNFATNPWNNYSDLAGNGVQSLGKNLYIESEPGIRIGVWHVFPKRFAKYGKDRVEKSSDFDFLDDSDPVIVYLHGNSFSRAQGHRVDLYNVLSTAGYHILALDYRGFGDSTGKATEEGCIRDAEVLYQLVRKHAGGNRKIFVWGHSLGTAIGTRLVAQLCNKDMCPDGLVLEAPFNNFTEIVRNHPFTQAYRFLPFFDRMLVEPCRKWLNIDMATDVHILEVQCPILIMHSHDDHIVPIMLAQRLYEVAKQAGKTVRWVEFEKIYGYRHNYIWRAPELVNVVDEFFKVNDLSQAPEEGEASKVHIP